MNDIEDRLRDAYRCATDTVRPEAIRGLGDHATGFSPSSRWLARGALHRLLVPLTAAAAVLVIGVVAAVVVPDALHNRRLQGNSTSVPLAGNPATHFLVGLARQPRSSYLSIRSAITGAAVATLAAPAGTLFGPAATADGVSYVVGVTRAGQCGQYLLRFKISRKGQPSRLTGFEPGYLGSQLIEHLAISRNGRIVAFDSRSCIHRGGAPDAGTGRPYIGVITTRQTSKNTWTSSGKYWSLPRQSFVSSLSLTADGRHIEFSTVRTTANASNIYLLPTKAAHGSALQSSRVIVRAAEFGAPTTISSSVMTPDGKTIYFSTYKTGRASSGRWALRAVDVASGRSRVITVKRGFGVRIIASPSGRELIAFVQAAPIASPSPSPSPSWPPSPTGAPSPVPSGSFTLSPSPSGSPSQFPTVTPSPSPSGSPSQFPTVTPSPSPSGSRSPVPTTSPSPSPSSSRAIAPLAAATLDAAFAPVDVIRIEFPGGRIRYLNPVPWDVANFLCVW